MKTVSNLNVNFSLALTGVFQIVALLALVAVAVAGPISPDANAIVLKHDSDNLGLDNYRYE